MHSPDLDPRVVLRASLPLPGDRPLISSNLKTNCHLSSLLRAPPPTAKVNRDHLYPFLRAAKCHRFSSLTPQKFVLSVLETEVQTQGVAGPCCLWDSGQRPAFPFPASGDGGSARAPWPTGASLQSLPLSSHGLLPVRLCLHMAFSFSYKDSSQIRSEPILMASYLQRPHFQIRSRSQVP